jgi:hypothetical protein
MHSLAVASASTPIDSTGNQPAARFVQPIEADDRPPRLRRDAVDQALSAITINRSRRSLFATASDAAFDDLFALD